MSRNTRRIIGRYVLAAAFWTYWIVTDGWAAVAFLATWLLLCPVIQAGIEHFYYKQPWRKAMREGMRRALL